MDAKPAKLNQHDEQKPTSSGQTCFLFLFHRFCFNVFFSHIPLLYFYYTNLFFYVKQFYLYNIYNLNNNIFNCSFRFFLVHKTEVLVFDIDPISFVFSQKFAAIKNFGIFDFVAVLFSIFDIIKIVAEQI